jgi:hypothetical protein
MFIMPKKVKDFAWKWLVIGNTVLTLFLFYILYSQISYLTYIVEHKLPYTVPEVSSKTAVVINPLTGSFVIINSPVILTAILGVIIIFGLVYLFKRH